ncbi:MAG: zinc-dependent metalloprotease [Flavipsychrobacter sp.]|nr:zinc-dependent metalloprotease [Flavipsychrobacter sp.]
MRYILLLAALACYCSHLYASTPLEMFIMHEKDITPFTSVSLWQPVEIYNVSNTTNYVEHAQFFNIDISQLAVLLKTRNRGITIQLPKKDGGVYTISLAQYNCYTADFKVQSIAGNIKTDRPYAAGIYYRGIVDGVPNSLASFSFFNDEVYGLFSIPGEGNYNLVPNHLASNNNKLSYILYNDKDSKLKPSIGCTEDLLESKKNYNLSAVLARNAYNTCREIKVFEKADYQLYQKYGSVTAVANYVTACFNASSTIYRNEGIYTTMKLLQVDTVTDIYNDPSYTSGYSFLNLFSVTTKDTLNGADVAMLLSGAPGQLGGIAWVGTLCQSFNPADNSGPYGFVDIMGDYATLPTFSYDVVTIAHEIGHTLGSVHTHNCSWPGGAIDGCYTLEGNCQMPVPQYPVNGGTIMSYCFLISGVGINISNGFGPLPGNVIRNTVATTSCGNIYSVSNALASPGTSLSANRECTMNGITYYWNDNNTADTSDDKLLLQINKNGNNIGTIDSPGFVAQTATNTGYGSGTGAITNFPSGTSPVIQDTSYAMHRYWYLHTSIAPGGNIEVMFPYLQADKHDLLNSLLTPVAADSTIYMYMVNTGNPNPSLGFLGAVATNFTICVPGSTLAANTWTESTTSNINFAHLLTNASSVGGSGFVTYKKYLSAGNIPPPSDPLAFFPNPAKSSWNVIVPNGLNDVLLQLYDAQGKIVLSQLLYHPGFNTINIGNLSAGEYFYRVAGSQVYTGKLVKE